jgi:hypothetical protein
VTLRPWWLLAGAAVVAVSVWVLGALGAVLVELSYAFRARRVGS